jgi:hypothetical protein
LAVEGGNCCNCTALHQAEKQQSIILPPTTPRAIRHSFPITTTAAAVSHHISSNNRSKPLELPNSMAEEKQVLVRFVTKLPPELHVPQTEVVGLAAAAAAGYRLLLLLLLDGAKSKLWTMGCLQAVPASLKRYGLSQIINHLLALGECLFSVGTAQLVRRKASAQPNSNTPPFTLPPASAAALPTAWRSHDFSC